VTVTIRLVRMLLLSCACAISLGVTSEASAQSVRISMSASSNRVAIGEPFAVEIRVETKGQDVDQLELPDFGELEVLGRSTSRPFSFSFGFGTGGQRALVKSEIVHSFTLRSTAAGAYVIRPAVVRAGGRRIASQSLSIMVVDPARSDPHAPPAAARANPNDALAPPDGELDGAQFDQTMFLRTVVDKKRAYVGEQVTVTVYLYIRGQIGDTPSITREPTLEGFWSQDLLPMQRSLSSTRHEINGRMFNAYVLRRFAAFPLRPGKLEVGAPAIELGGGGSIFDLLTGPSQPTRRNGVKVAVEALPLPNQPTPGAPTFTGTLALEAALDPAQAKVGDAVTLRLSAKGRGNLRSLSLPTPTIPELEVLPPELDDSVTNEFDQVGGERVMRWLLLPRAPRRFVVPSFAVDVFDPQTGKFSTVRSAPLTLTASGGQAEPAVDPSASAPEESTVRFGPARNQSALLRRSLPLHERPLFWPGVLAAPGLLGLLFAARWLRRRAQGKRVLGRDALALQEAEAKLQRAQEAAQQGDAQSALSQLTGALKGTLEARLGETLGGLTTRALALHLHARGLDERLIERAVAQLSALERARFDPDAQRALELSRAVEGVRALTRELGRARVQPLATGATRDDVGRGLS